MSEPRPIDDGNCFACGVNNPSGLQLRFEPDGEFGVCAHVRIPERFQGWKGVVHGGIVMTLLDEAMAHAAARTGAAGFTASVNVRFRGAAPVDAPLELRGRVVEQRRNVVSVEARLEDGTGGVLCEASGKLVGRGTLVDARALGSGGRVI